MYDVIIIGAGASGLMAGAILCNKNVLIIEKNSSAGKKLLITGGGRCNLTNLKENNLFLNEIYNKKYLYSTINNFGPKDVYNFFIEKGVELKEEEDNKIFPLSNKSIDIVNCLVKLNKNILYNNEVNNIEYKDNLFNVFVDNKKYSCKYLIIATGGISYQITGSVGDYIKFANIFKQPLIDYYPAESKIELIDYFNIPGTSIENVIVKAGKFKSSGNLMFTHNGLGGKAIMDISGEIYKNKIKEIYIDFLPSFNLEELINIFNSRKEEKIFNVLNDHFSKRFINYFLNYLNVENKKISSLSKSELNKIFDLIKNKCYHVNLNFNITNAYVTGGGIDLNYIDTKTFQSKINNNLYFIGESLDVRGPIGGYNLTLAFSTGYSASKSIIEKENINV